MSDRFCNYVLFTLNAAATPTKFWSDYLTSAPCWVERSWVYQGCSPSPAHPGRGSPAGEWRRWSSAPASAAGRGLSSLPRGPWPSPGGHGALLWCPLQHRPQQSAGLPPRWWIKTSVNTWTCTSGKMHATQRNRDKEKNRHFSAPLLWGPGRPHAVWSVVGLDGAVPEPEQI